MRPDEMNDCDVSGCHGWKRHIIQIGPRIAVEVCDRCQDAVFALGRAFDREHITLNEKYFRLFRELKGETNEDLD